MENTRGKEGAGPGRSVEEQGGDRQPSTSRSSSSTKGQKRKRCVENGKEKKEQGHEAQTPRKKIAIPPLPVELPPVNLVHRDVLRAWCQQLKLSTKGQKLEAYRRLCEYAYPQQKNIPSTPKEARYQASGRQRKRSLESPEGRMSSTGPNLSEVALDPERQLAALEEPPALYEEVSTSVMTVATPESVLASWGRIAAGAGRTGTEEPPAEACGDKWCVVHGRSLPAVTRGWVRLQFHAGQAWVPEKKGRVSALFLLPAGAFPPPHLEDNLLCPICVRRNKILAKSLRWE
ncbi:developmental pluripotency-associated protein 4 [Octodon degus]|uniref:Developmental pluripotency-associated protein 4 n=1 Tax=Octodon degus TaxID=10160 RepID=A0A6P3FMA0_OCTDE|nr:developmental pluripotency-associated protein 4 [Octodon degus]